MSGRAVNGDHETASANSAPLTRRMMDFNIRDNLPGLVPPFILSVSLFHRKFSHLSADSHSQGPLVLILPALSNIKFV